MPGDPGPGKRRERAFNGLTAKEWAVLSSNVWRGLSPPRDEKRKEHGATFPEPFASRIIKIYTKQEDVVLDPFVGIGTTLEACKNTGRKGIGFEINPKYAKYAKENAMQQTLIPFGSAKVYEEDCRNLLSRVGPDTV